MKTYIFILILASIVFGSCREKKSQPFNTSLLQVILEAKDSLKSKDNKLLSIEFNYQDRYERGCMMKVFASNCYASGYIDAYTKIGNATVAIYNLKDDIYETINKNDIAFFSDTIKGFRDTCVLFQTKDKVFYSMYKPDSIIKVKSITVNNIIEKYLGGTSPKFISIDIEGHDFEVIQSIDLDKYRPLVIVVETIEYRPYLPINVKKYETVEYLKTKDYVEYAFTGINSILIDAKYMRDLGQEG